MRRFIIRFVQAMPLCMLAMTCGATDKKQERLVKVDTALAVLFDEYSGYLEQGGTGAFTPSNPLLRVTAGRVVIDAVASGDTRELKADLETLGMQRAVAFGRIVSGQLPIPAIKALPALTSLQFARPSYVTTRETRPPAPNSS